MFNNLIIISIYDGVFRLTIWIDGKKIPREHGLFRYVRSKCYLSVNDVNSIANKYKRSILLCDCGDIEFYKYND